MFQIMFDGRNSKFFNIMSFLRSEVKLLENLKIYHVFILTLSLTIHDQREKSLYLSVIELVDK